MPHPTLLSGIPHQEFFTGLVTAGFLVCTLFFVRFWTQTRDFLFLAFAIAFALLAAQQILGVFLEAPLEERSWIYILRLIAFIVVIVAILRKNVRR